MERESREERKGQTLKRGNHVGPVGHSRDSDVYPKSNGKPLKDSKQGSDRAGAFENVPCDSTGSLVQSGFRTIV